MSFKIEPTSVKATLQGLDTIQDKMFEALRIISHSAAKQMEAYAKANARWVDRTGNARQKLTGDAYWVNPKTLETVIMHQMDYGVWLELAMGRKYAILEESLKQVTPDLLKAYKKLVGDVM